MADIPRSVLSAAFQEKLEGRRLVSAVFTTYQLDPGFFEQEVLPAVLDTPLSHAVPVRLLQLEDALRSLHGHVAVYYDASGLVNGDSGSARLDIERVPVRHRTGIFHPKNVFLLVEDLEPNEDGTRQRALLAAALSANLTRPGWWENVECCHIELLEEGSKTCLRDDLLDFLDWLQKAASAHEEHLALAEIRKFVRGMEQRLQKTTDGFLQPHFYSGREAFMDFLDAVAGDLITGSYLEIISPYFDQAQQLKPLRDLIDRLQPKEVRVFLPRGPAGEALCGEKIYEWVHGLENVMWGRLPKNLVKLGSSEDAGERRVHAKVYRFFRQSPKREIVFVGSVNLTNAAHARGGNMETGFLLQVDLPRRPEFWLEPDAKAPIEFQQLNEETEQGIAEIRGSRLSIRHRWDRGTTEVYWDDADPSPVLSVSAQGQPLFPVGPLEAKRWTGLGAEDSRKLAAVLASTSFLSVTGDGKGETILLVEELGMSHKPSLLFQLSVADILRYWALLSAEQRAAFLEARASEIAAHALGADLIAVARIPPDRDSLFARFAGFFYAFGSLERAVEEALGTGNEREAAYRVFGRKYDSLGNLLARVAKGQDPADPVDRYVIALCARQLFRNIEKGWPEFWKAHAEDVHSLEQTLALAELARSAIETRNPKAMAPFLDWFERWFLKRAAPVEAAK